MPRSIANVSDFERQRKAAEMIRTLIAALCCFVSLIVPDLCRSQDEQVFSDLPAAILAQDVAGISAFIESKEDLNEPDARKWVPLTYAANTGNTSILKLLQNAGAHLTVPDDLVGPLHMAAESGDIDMLKFLIDAGAEVDQHGPNGATPLHVAVMFGHTEAVKYLLNHGAKVNAEESLGFKLTPFDYALRYHRDGIRALLTEHGGKSNSPMYEYYKLMPSDKLEEGIADGNGGRSQLNMIGLSYFVRDNDREILYDLLIKRVEGNLVDDGASEEVDYVASEDAVFDVTGVIAVSAKGELQRYPIIGLLFNDERDMRESWLLVDGAPPLNVVRPLNEVRTELHGPIKYSSAREPVHYMDAISAIEINRFEWLQFTR